MKRYFSCLQRRSLYERTSEENMCPLVLQGIIILSLIREKRRERFNRDLSYYSRSIGKKRRKVAFLPRFCICARFTSTLSFSYSFDYTIDVVFLSILIVYSNLPASDDLYDANLSRKTRENKGNYLTNVFDERLVNKR